MRRYIRSERVKLPRVQRIVRGSKRYKYHRPTGTPLPVDVPEDHPLFIDAWTKAEAIKKPQQVRAPGSLAARCEAALQSAQYQTYAESYRYLLRRHIDAISEAYGTAPVAGMKLGHVEADLAKLSPTVARARAKAWRFVFKGVKPNPTAGLKLERLPKTQGYPTWSVQDIAKFRDKWPWGTVQRLAFEVVYWSAAATSDAVTLGPHMIQDGLLVYARGKTTVLAHVPWTCPLPPFARAWEAERAELLAHLRDAPTYLAVGQRRRSHWGLSNLIAEAAREAGVQKSAHGLRKARLTRIAEAKGTAHAIMAWGGHATLSEAERYTRAANLRGLVMGEQEANAVDEDNPLVKGADLG